MIELDLNGLVITDIDGNTVEFEVTDGVIELPFTDQTQGVASQISNNTKETDFRVKELEGALRNSHEWLGINPEYEGSPLSDRNITILSK